MLSNVQCSVPLKHICEIQVDTQRSMVSLRKVCINSMNSTILREIFDSWKCYIPPRLINNIDTFINISLPHFNTDKPNAEYPYFLSPLFFHMYVLRQCSLLSLRIYDNCDFDLLWSQKALSIWSCIFH